MQLLALGQTRWLDHSGAEHALGARKQRAVLAALALHLDRDVPATTLADLVWGGRPPAGAHGTLHSYISSVRRTLAGVGADAVLATSDLGYRLRLRREDVDVHAFTDRVREAHRALAPLAGQLRPGVAAAWPSDDDVGALVVGLEEAIGWWAGEAYGDLPDHPDLLAVRASLGELRTSAELDRLLGLLALGDHATVVAASEQLTARHPLSERTWALHALALARTGRQGDALAALRRARDVLADELGLDPGQELQVLEQALLRQEELPTRTTPTSTLVPTPVSPTSRGEAPPGRASPPWPVVGRDAELAALARAVDEAGAGTTQLVQVVGEAGIGKSRLVQELVTYAAARGVRVALARCSQDDGAPPLWPWRAVVAELFAETGGSVPDALRQVLEGTPSEASGSPELSFQVWETLRNVVLERTRHEPVLLVLDDLHWADTATIRALRHLVATVPDDVRLLCVVTRRPYPEPAGELGALVEALARRHVLHLELDGLTDEASTALVNAVAGETPGEAAALWSARAGGNPYFLIELARLADRSGADSAPLPATVLGVVQSRLSALPEVTQDLLVQAAVLGRRFPLDLLAAVADHDPDAVDGALAPARAAGLVSDVDGSWTAFAHALTRDAVAATATRSRVQRIHARAAHALDREGSLVLTADERVAELARHWSAAGPAHAPQAWRANLAAAAQARSRYAREEASSHMGAALDAHRRDPAATPEERHELLLAWAHDRQIDGEWTEIHRLTSEAVASARAAGDPVRVAEAAATNSRDSVWVSVPWFTVDEDVVDDLRWALRHLPEKDSPDRCRALLGLAVQLVYDPGGQAEAAALADEGMAMARRIGGPDLLWWAARAAGVALWRPSRAAARRELSREGLAAARATGDDENLSVALVVAAGDALELGDRDAYDAYVGEAERIVRRRRNGYALIAIDWMQLGLATMRGDEEEAARRTAEVYDLAPRTSREVRDMHRGALALFGALWNGGLEEMAPAVAAATDAVQGQMGRDVLHLALARLGDVGRLRSELRNPIRHPVENWSSSATAACVAESAAVADDHVEATHARDRLAPLSGRMAVAGYSVVHGPTDGYLALAHATLGERDEATAAADAASALASTWGLDRYSAWLAAHRERLDF